MTARVDLDKVGATASTVCAVHCFITGVAFGLLPLIGLGFFRSVWTDAAFIGIAITVGFFAVRQGIRRHGRLTPAIVFVTGLLSIVLGHFVLGHESVLGTVLSVGGGLALVSFHFMNRRMTSSSRA